MSRKTNAVSSASENNETSSSNSETQSNDPVLSGRAIGVTKDPSTGLFVTSVLEFDLNGNARVVRSVNGGASKMEASEQFKIMAVEEGVVL